MISPAPTGLLGMMSPEMLATPLTWRRNLVLRGVTALPVRG